MGAKEDIDDSSSSSSSSSDGAANANLLDAFLAPNVMSAQAKRKYANIAASSDNSEISSMRSGTTDKKVALDISSTAEDNKGGQPPSINQKASLEAMGVSAEIL